MTVKQLKEQLATYADTFSVVIETRIKTGYDEGDIYIGDPEIKVFRNELRISQKNYSLVGGW